MVTARGQVLETSGLWQRSNFMVYAQLFAAVLRCSVLKLFKKIDPEIKQL